MLVVRAAVGACVCCRWRGSGRVGLAWSARVGGGGVGASQRLRVWWKRSILPWVWGWPGWPFFWVMPQGGEEVFEVVAAVGESCGVDAVRCRSVWRRAARRSLAVAMKLVDDVGAGDAGGGRCRPTGIGSGRRAS